MSSNNIFRRVHDFLSRLDVASFPPAHARQLMVLLNDVESSLNPVKESIDDTVKKIMAERIAMQEHYVARYLAATGLDIRDVDLCECTATDDQGKLTTSWWLRPKTADQEPESISHWGMREVLA